MAMSAVVLGAATSTFVRQQRGAGDHAARSRAESQLRAAIAELHVALAGLSPGAGDLAAGEARDTAVQLRTVVGNAVTCDSSAGQVTIAADDSSNGSTNGFATAPRIGDTIWWRRRDTSAWAARVVRDVAAATGPCRSVGGAMHSLLRLTFGLPDTVPRGVPVRLTRQTRYAFYRAADGTWQLGVAEWSEVLHAFASPQPIAGPFTLVAPDGARTGFRWFASDGTPLPVGTNGIDVTRVARVRAQVIAPIRAAPGVTASYRRDSLDVALHDAP